MQAKQRESMKKVDFREIVDNAVSSSKHGKEWHFHMLGKDCKFNVRKGKFAIVFEDEESGESLYALCDSRPSGESKRLADLMYGKGFLEKLEKDGHNPDFDVILQNAEEMTSKRIEWHHHHLPPNCAFNGRKGKHCIVLENANPQEVLIAVYARKPMEDLVKIEKLCYKDVK